MTSIKFGVGCDLHRGHDLPVPFAKPDDVVRVAVEAERLGYYEVMGNDP